MTREVKVMLPSKNIIEFACQAGAAGRRILSRRLDPADYLCLELASGETGRKSPDISKQALSKNSRSMSKRVLKDCTCLKKT